MFRSRPRSGDGTPASPDPADRAATGPDPTDQDAATPVRTFDRRNVLFLSGAHFAHDCYPAFLGVMLPLLIEELSISLAAAGVLASSIRWTTSLQPILGHVADRTDTRYWVILTPATTAICMSLLGVAPNSATVLVLLLLTGVSHAAFHPAGGALATQSSGAQWGKGMSYFMTGGELGRVVGPLLIAGVLGVGGLTLSPVAVIPGLLASVVLYRRFGAATSIEARSRPPARIRAAIATGRRPLVLLACAIFLRAFGNVGFVVFYPTYATRLGHPLLLAGVALAIYEIGAVGGTFLGGTLSDRHGRARVMLAGLLAAALPLIGAVLLGPTPLGLLLLLLGGFTWLSASSIELVLMQQLLPDNRSAAVGLTYFIKAAGTIVSTIAIGAVGSVFGLRLALVGAVCIGLLGVPFVAMIREPEQPVGS